MLRQRFIRGEGEVRSIVTDTVVVSESAFEEEKMHTAASAFADSGDLVWVAAKAADVLLDPAQSYALIVETVVGFVAGFAQFFGCQPASSAESVAVACQ